jgi:hypothetical protein
LLVQGSILHPHSGPFRHYKHQHTKPEMTKL